jgi:pimeloyl-ACP methyl ester carboxylesterase
MEAIYATALPNAKRNPVVLVHGFAGSTLRRIEDGATVWGTLFTKDSLLPSKQQGLKAFALDIDRLQPPVESGQVAFIEDDTQAVAFLEKVKADAGVMDVNVSIYSALVELMEASGYSECQADPRAITSLESPPCLTFFYDWRQDNVGNAIQLGAFLEKAQAQIETIAGQEEAGDPQEVRFDLIAHSMGGLVARYLLRYGAQDVLEETEPRITWAGAKYLDRLIAISTPNFGAMRVLKEMVIGRRYPVVKFEPAMIATWVSAYQMLPRTHHAVWLGEDGEPIEVDILSANTWVENGWGPFAPGQDKYLAWIYPGESSPGDRRERVRGFMDAAFERARRFYRVMDQHPDTECPTELTLFASDVQPTPARAAVMQRDGKQVIRFENTKKLTLKAPGDGSVTRASAVADERLLGGDTGFVTSPVPWDQRIFLTDMHMTFLANPTFQNNLLHILLEVPPSRRAEAN